MSTPFGEPGRKQQYASLAENQKAAEPVALACLMWQVEGGKSHRRCQACIPIPVPMQDLWKQQLEVSGNVHVPAACFPGVTARLYPR